MFRSLNGIAKIHQKLDYANKTEIFLRKVLVSLQVFDKLGRDGQQDYFVEGFQCNLGEHHDDQVLEAYAEEGDGEEYQGVDALACERRHDGAEAEAPLAVAMLHPGHYLGVHDRSGEERQHRGHCYSEVGVEDVVEVFLPIPEGCPRKDLHQL